LLLPAAFSLLWAGYYSICTCPSYCALEHCATGWAAAGAMVLHFSGAYWKAFGAVYFKTWAPFIYFRPEHSLVASFTLTLELDVSMGSRKHSLNILPSREFINNSHRRCTAIACRAFRPSGLLFSTSVCIRAGFLLSPGYSIETDRRYVAGGRVSVSCHSGWMAFFACS